MLGSRGRYNFSMGHHYAEISIEGNSVATALSVGSITQITEFDTAGESRGICSCADEDHLVILDTGIYMVNYSISLQNDAVQSHVVSVSAYTNNGTVELVNAHSHRNLTGGSGDTGSMSCCSVCLLEAGETLELWASSDSADARNVIFEDVTFNVLRLSGV